MLPSQLTGLNGPIYIAFVDYAVIRVVGGKTDEKGQAELVARFATLEEARRVAQSAQQNELKNSDEYLVTSDPDALISAAVNEDQ